MTKCFLSIAVLIALAACSDGSGAAGLDGDGSEEGHFLSPDAMVVEMSEAEADFPTIVELVDLTARYGTPPTHGGRRLHAVKISDNVLDEEDEPAFLMVAAHHGNEIGTPVVALDAIDRLTSGYGDDPTITDLVDDYEIWIAPLWNPDGYPATRKNGRPGGTVDVNRNYPFLWDTACSGSTNPGSATYKGPVPGSEPETRTMIAFAQDRRFAKVLDIHSSGREIVFGYLCSPHHLLDYLEVEAAALSVAAGYGGRSRSPSAEGEHYQWQLGSFANYSFLIEISDTQSPTFQDAEEEAARVWPGTLWMLERPIPVRGHVTDAGTGDPVEADITYVENPFTRGEQNRSEPLFGRFHAFLPTGEHTLRFSHPDYVTEEVPVTVTTEGTTVEVQLVRAAPGR